MTSTAQKWLIGCGIGCGVMILLTVLLVGGGFFAVRGLKDRFDTAQNKATVLTEQFGEPEDWTPPADGAVPPARLDLFLAVRDSLADLDVRFAETFAAFERVSGKGEGRQDLGSVLRAVRGGMSMAPLIGDYLGRRNSALVAVGMGLGEYTYIYALGYYGYLGRSPEASPRQVKHDDGEDGREVRPRLHRHLLAMLRNQLDAVEKAEGARHSAWRDTLAAEIEALAGHPRLLPWERGLPVGIAASFAPRRERLEATWSEASNVFALTSSRGGHNELHIEN